MTSLTTFLLGNFFFNLKQLSKFEWVFLFFSHTNLTFDKKTQKKAKRREKIRNKWTRPSKQKKLCWRNKSREKKKNFSPHSQVAFFFLVTNDNKWPMTTSVSFWDKLDLLARMIVLKKKRNNSLTKCKRSRRRIQPKKNNIAALNWKKKNTWAFLF